MNIDPQNGEANKWRSSWALLVSIMAVAVGVSLFVASIARADRKRDEGLRIIGEIYNSGTGELGAYVYATNAQHKFENGKVEEGWLVRPVDVPGATPIWTVKPQKARVVWR